MRKLKTRNVLPSLEEAILGGVEALGKAGTSFLFASHGEVPLRLQVRVVSAERELLPFAPYSLTFACRFCGGFIAEDWGTGIITCNNCSADQDWLSDCSVMSIWAPEGKASPTGLARRASSLNRLAHAHSELRGLQPLEATIAAGETLLLIEKMHGEFLIPAWATYVAEQVLELYPA